MKKKKTSLLIARTPICSRRENCKRFCDPMESNNACKSKEDIHKKNEKKWKKLKHRSHFVIMMYNNYVCNHTYTYKKRQKYTEIILELVVSLYFCCCYCWISFPAKETPSNPSNNFKVKWLKKHIHISWVKK